MGRPTVDEMARPWVDVTYISQEEHAAELARRVTMTDDPNNEGPGGR